MMPFSKLKFSLTVIILLFEMVICNLTSNNDYSYLEYYKNYVPISVENKGSDYVPDNQLEDLSYCLNRTKEWYKNVLSGNHLSSDHYEVYIKNLTHLSANNLGIRNMYLHNNYNNSLKHFDISNNLLESLNNIINNRFPILESVDASSNVLKCVKTKLIKNWPTIHNMNFSRNCLTDFPLEYFINQKRNFSEINLSYNLLRKLQVFIPVNWNWTNIETLDLSHNKIETILLTGLNIKKLILNNNSIKSMHYYSCGAFEDMNNRDNDNDVNHLVDLRNNLIKYFHSNCPFRNLTLVNNRIDNLNFLYTIKSIETLNMTNNIIRNVFSFDKTNRSLSFSRFIKSCDLKVLDLSYNLLYSIYLDDFKIFNRLEYLSLEANNLKVIDYKNLLKVLPKLKFLNLRHNRFTSNYKNEISDFFKFETDLKIKVY